MWRRLSSSPQLPLGAPCIFLGQVWAEEKGELATSRLRADCGWETEGCVHRHDLHGSRAINDKTKKHRLGTRSAVFVCGRPKPSRGQQPLAACQRCSWAGS